MSVTTTGRIYEDKREFSPQLCKKQYEDKESVTCPTACVRIKAMVQGLLNLGLMCFQHSGMLLLREEITGEQPARSSAGGQTLEGRKPA